MLHALLLFVDLFNPQSIIQYGGLTLLLIIVFAETGIFFGFFLPGDSLLFVAGVLCESQHLALPVWLLITLVALAAVAGTCAGYGFGYWAEEYLKRRKENFFYKKKYLDMTQTFYKRYGMMTFIVGRFLPVVRTFIPILAGIAKIRFVKFLFYNLLGAIIWVTVMIMSGYLAGNAFPAVSEHIEIIVAGMILITSVPLILSLLKNNFSASKEDPNE